MIEHWNLLSISLKMMSFLIKEITKEVIPQEVIEQAERETIIGNIKLAEFWIIDIEDNDVDAGGEFNVDDESFSETVQSNL